MRERRPIPLDFDATDLEHLARAVRLGHRKFGMELETVADGFAIYSDAPLARPGAQDVQVADEKALDGTVLRRAAEGQTLVAWNAQTKTATFAKPLPLAAQIRDDIAEHLRARFPWMVEVQVFFDPSGRLDRVELLRAPAVSNTVEGRLKVWHELIARIEGTDAGWTATDNSVGRSSATLAFGVKRALPSFVDGRTLLPSRAAEAWECNWQWLPFGRDAFGNEVGIDFVAGPHASIIGGTGSGKSTAARLIIMQAIARGFDVLLVDPTKNLGGLVEAESYASGTYVKSSTEAMNVIKSVYGEVKRRVQVITTFVKEDGSRGEDWLDLPPGTVRPILLVVDEWAGLMTLDEKPHISLKGTEDWNEWERETLARSSIKTTVGKLAAQSRSAGVHVILLSQIASVEFIPTNIRNNLGTSVQLIGKKKVQAAHLEMVFPTQSAEAAEEILELNNPDKGFALAVTDGGSVEGFRVGYVDKAQVVPLLDGLGAPKGVPFVVASSAPAAPSAPAQDF